MVGGHHNMRNGVKGRSSRKVETHCAKLLPLCGECHLFPEPPLSLIPLENVPFFWARSVTPVRVLLTYVTVISN